MPADDDKRAAQLAFLSVENVRLFYQQVIAKGYLEADKDSLTQQITQDIYPEIEQPDMQREMGLEPER